MCVCVGGGGGGKKPIADAFTKAALSAQLSEDSTKSSLHNKYIGDF